MTHTKTFATSVLSALLLAGPAYAEMPTADKPLKITYATYLAPNVAFTQADAWFMKEITERSAGGIVFETYYSGSLLPAGDIYPGVGKGAVDIVLGSPGYHVDLMPISNVIQPFITDKVDAVMYAVKELYDTEPSMQAEWSSNNMVLLYPMAAGENSIWLSKRVEKAEDLAGLRIRATVGIAQAINALGATSVALPVTDAIEGLKTGAIEGIASLPFDTAMDLGLHEVATYTTDAGRMGIYGLMGGAANKQWWDGLDPEVRDLIASVAVDVPQKYLDLLAAKLEGQVATLADSKIEVVSLSEEENARWREKASEAVSSAWLAKVAAKNLDGAPILKRFRELVTKFEAQSTYATGLDLYRKKTGKN